jgi:hypothetical protein
MKEVRGLCRSTGLVVVVVGQEVVLVTGRRLLSIEDGAVGRAQQPRQSAASRRREI